jgi:PilZ domain-containing protein
MPETGEQRRRFFRRRMLKGARIVFNGSSIFSCRVRDISEGGARLEIGNTLPIPDEFTLTMEGWIRASQTQPLLSQRGQSEGILCLVRAVRVVDGRAGGSHLL